MNILYLTNIFSDKAGGSEWVFWLYAKYMAQRSHNIIALSYSCDEESLSRLGNVHDKVNVIELFPNIKHKGMLFHDVWTNTQYLRKGVKAIKKLREEVDIIHSNTYIPALIGSVAKNLLKKPHVLTVHDVGSVMGSRFLYRWFREGGNNPISSFAKTLAGVAYEHFILRFISKDAIVVPSVQTQKDVTTVLRNNRLSKKMYVLPNFIDTETYGYYKHCYGITYEPYALYIGRLVFYKNVHMLIDLFKEVTEYDKHAKLVIIGNGPLEPLLRSYIHKHNLERNIVILGSVDQREKLKWLSQCSVVVNPSILEGFSLVVLEAWYFEKPIIVSNLPPLNELVDNGLNGFTINLTDRKKIVELMLSLIEDKALARRLGTMGYNKVVSHFVPEKVICQLEKVYTMIAQ